MACKFEEEFNPWPSFVDIFSSVILVLLLFLLPQHLVNGVIKSIIHTLHITTTGKGVAFAFPLSHMKGISLTKEDIFKEKAYQVNINKDEELGEIR